MHVKIKYKDNGRFDIRDENGVELEDVIRLHLDARPNNLNRMEITIRPKSFEFEGPADLKVGI